ncbi:MAG: late competence development ComFB family protein [Spirochaetes bacterium]|nr:late competence development ComFB family protein [Spirochaetota bacterium]
MINIMEDKIKAAVNEILSVREDRFILIKFMEDIIAYVLNRVPPRYVTSERGYVHNEIDFSVNTQLHADIRFCVNEAINTLSHRREPDLHSILSLENVVSKHYYYPYIVGEVLEESTFSVIPDVEINLMYNDYPVPMIDPGWNNPFITCKATRGFYLFWPDFLKGEMSTASDNIFKIIFRHKKFYKKEISFSMRALEKFNYNKSQIVPLVLMRLQDSENI